jgi:hypothetical protein
MSGTGWRMKLALAAIVLVILLPVGVAFYIAPPRWPSAVGFALMLLSVIVLKPVFARLHGGIIAAVALLAVCLIAMLPHGSSLDPPVYSYLSPVLPVFPLLALVELVLRARQARKG